MLYYPKKESENASVSLLTETAQFIIHWEADIMPLFNNENRILQIEREKEEIFQYMENPLISQPFTEDFARRFSWSTNAIEGNTLSLEETIAVIDYDEVKSNHTYSEYTDAKNAYYAIRKMLLPFAKKLSMKSGSRRRTAISDICRESIEIPRFILEICRKLYTIRRIRRMFRRL